MLNSGKEWDWMDKEINQSEYNKIVKSINDAETHEEVFTALKWISSYEKLNGKTASDRLRKIAVEQIKSI